MNVKDAFEPNLARCLELEGINTLEELANKSEVQLLRTANFGRKSILEFYRVLAIYGLTLK